MADRLSAWITREPFYRSRNYWMVHDGTQWALDPLWDKCFPKFKATSKLEAIRKYYEYYYEEADRLASKLEGDSVLWKSTDSTNRAINPESCGSSEVRMKTSDSPTLT